MFRSFWLRLARPFRKVSRTAARRLRPVVEGLEERSLLAAHVWTGAVGALWSDDGNWDVGAPVIGEPNVTLRFPTGVSITSTIDDLNGLAVDNITFEAAYDIFGNLGPGATQLILTGAAGTNILALVDGSRLEQSIDLLLNGANTIQVDSGALQIDSTISDNGLTQGSIVKEGAGRLKLNALGTNPYTGGATVNGGILELDQSQNGAVTLNSGTILEILAGGFVAITDLTITDSTVDRTTGGPLNATLDLNGTLTMSGGLITGITDLNLNTSVVVPNTATNTAVIDVSTRVALLSSGTTFTIADAAPTVDMEIRGDLTSVAGGMVKDGTGVLRLTGDAAPGSGTQINAGLLLSDGLLAGTATVNNGGALGGSGTVTDVTANAGGTIQPGPVTGPGILSGQTIAFTTGASFLVELNGNQPGIGYDQLVASTIGLNGATLNPTLGYSPVLGDQLKIIDNIGIDPISGTFAGLPEGSLVIIGGKAFQLTYAGGNGNDVVLTNVQSTTTTTLTADPPAGAVFGQTVTLTATVTPGLVLPTPPSGTVDFFSNGTMIGSALLNASGQAVLTTTLSTGNDTLIAIYNGDANYSGSSSTPFEYTVSSASTTTTVSGDPNPSTVGGDVTFSVLVAAVAPGSGIPRGIVDFFDGATPLGSANLNDEGRASFTTNALSVGSHNILARYGGNADFQGSDGTTTQVVNQIATTTSVDSSANPSTFNQSVTFTATVTFDPTLFVPSGVVTFFDGGTPIGSGAIDSLGVATFTTSALNAGTHTITAMYSGDTNFAPSTSPDFTQTVNKANTSTLLQSSANPSNLGQSVTFTATVSTGGPGPIPSGTVSFFDGATLLGTSSLDVSGQATFSTSSLTAGSHVISATYNGSNNYNTSSSSPLNQNVNQAATTTSVLGSPNPSVIGQSVTFTATVTSGATGFTPTGTVSFLDGGTPLGSGTLDANGQATFTTSNLTIGMHTITAVYGGDTNFTGSQGSTGQTVNQIETATSVASSVNPSVFGQNVTFTATVTFGAAPFIPTGSVTFFDGGSPIGSGPINAQGVATFSTSTLNVAAHTITASYSGDTNFAASTSAPLSQTVNRAATSTSVISSVNPSVVGQDVTFTVTVAAVAPGTGTPTGIVSFLDGATPIGSGTLNAQGQATLTTASLTVGSHNITAIYGGDTNFTGSQGSTSQTVNTIATSTNVASSVNPSTVQQTVTFTATVSFSTTALIPTGTVTFFDGANQIGSSSINSQGVATFSTSALNVGNHAITATYSGDANFATSNSQALTQVVNRAATTTTIVSSANPSAFGQNVSFTATINHSTNGPTPTGTVLFFDGQTQIGSAQVNQQGQAVFSTTTLGAGTHAITAAFGGDANYTGSTSQPVNQVVNQGTTTTTVTSSANPAFAGQNVTFTATVASSVTGITPTGTVTFFDGQTQLGTGTVNAQGQASFSTNTLAVGTHTITATYGGSGNFTGSTSSPIDQVVILVSTTTTLSSSANPNPANQALTLTAQVAAPQGQGTPNGTVTFFNGMTSLGTVNLNNGVANLTVSLAPGSYDLSAQYSGTSTFAASASPRLSQVVTQVGTTTGIQSSPNPSAFFQPFTVTVTVTAQGGGVPTGTVTLFKGQDPVVSGTLTNGQVVFTPTLTDVGSVQLTAQYSGDATFSSSMSAPLTQTVVRANTTTQLQVSGTPTIDNPSLTLVASVSPAFGGAPTGSVTFRNGQTILDSVVLTRNRATLPLSNLAPGTYNFTATYNGDTNYNSSVSQVVTITIAACDPNTAYVEALYRDVLDRASDPAGLQYWVGQLNAGVSRARVAAGFWESLEHLTDVVQDYYQTFLDRAADGGGLQYWVGLLISGGTQADVVLGIVTSQEYLASHPTNSSYVEGLYQDVFNRSLAAGNLSAGEIAFWTRFLNAGQRDRADIAFYFLSAAESYQTAITEYYQLFLDRDPTANDRVYWFARLEAGLETPLTFAVSFLASDEFFNLAQQQCGR